MVVHTCSHSTWEVETRPEGQGHPEPPVPYKGSLGYIREREYCNVFLFPHLKSINYYPEQCIFSPPRDTFSLKLFHHIENQQYSKHKYFKTTSKKM